MMGDRGGGGGGGGTNGNNGNACLTMHQPWASLLVQGIKRIEGRSWPAPLRGRLWIHAAGKVPDAETIKAMEDFYREIYAVNGITSLQFPDHYPVSRLLGCVEVVGCLKLDELACWEEVPEGVRLEGQTKFCWLCEQPQKLLVPFEMRGYQGVYNLDRKIYEAAVRGLSLVEGPLPVIFPLPDPRDPFSLKPGSLSSKLNGSKVAEVEKPPALTAAIAGARAAATQFSKKEQKHDTKIVQEKVTFGSSTRRQTRNNYTEPDRNSAASFYCRPQKRDPLHGKEEQSSNTNSGAISMNSTKGPHGELNPQTGASPKIFAAALRGLKPA